jgi:hypothetical protein
VIRFPGEDEYAGTFLAQSFVFCVVEFVNAFDDRASRRGDVIPLLATGTGFVSVGLNRAASVDGDGLEVSLSPRISLQNSYCLAALAKTTTYCIFEFNFVTEGELPPSFAAPFFFPFFVGMVTPEDACSWLCFMVLEMLEIALVS